MENQIRPLQVLNNFNSAAIRAVNDPSLRGGTAEVFRRIHDAAPALSFERAEFAICLGRWRFSKGVYKVDPTVEELILDSEVRRIPREVLKYLPEWCVYIKTETVPGLDGFFFNSHQGEGLAFMQFLLCYRDRNEMHSIPLLDTVQESLEASDTVTLVQTEEEVLDILQRLLHLVLYLCAENAEIGPVRPTPARPQRRKRYRIPPRIREWEVAYRLGPELRRAQAHPSEVEGWVTGARKRPHVARAHFRNQAWGPSYSRHRLTWIAPQFKGFRNSDIDPGDQPAVRRDVSPQ